MDLWDEKGVGLLDAILRWATFATLVVVVLLAPWFFGAWEVWWFWPFIAVISVGMVSTGLRLVTGSSATRAAPPRIWMILGAAAPFLVYALVRLFTTEVFADGEKSVLLHLSGLAVAVQVSLGISGHQRRVLFWVIFASLSLLGLYGLVNHLGWGSEHVLWAPRYPQYAGRATGSYFCPDHFAGIMELLMCLALAVIADRGRRAAMRWATAGAVVLALTGVILSQSRGGGMAAAVILGAAMVWGVARWPRGVRWNLRLVAVSGSLLLLIGLSGLGGPYVERFVSYGGWTVSPEQEGGRMELLKKSLSRTSRGRMYGGAVRAWQTAPWIGIGPGMHQNIWPHVAATRDGDAAIGKWPTLSNASFHSYSVHSDWLQLLEEYGIVGLVLFMIPFCTVFVYLASMVSGWRPEALSGPAVGAFSHAVGAMLAFIAMAFHSLGDFNLQMPATVWLFAAILALGLNSRREIQETQGIE